MTIPTWPETLPLPERRGFQYSKGEARRQTPNDSGPPRISRRFSQTADPVQLVIDLTRDQLLIFEDFWETQTSGGSKLFRMENPILHEAPILDSNSHPLVDQSGNPLLLASIWLCLFGQQLPTYTTHGVRWHVTFQLMVMP